ncbi:hypothetical protein FACS1894172_10490 [Spirochaetia bacterium]|nr:hypothetical protein FACS1894164_10490 [Spirochaetia bacterium]GHU32939.1 hypothetical protein FACS1894172_10490 [Spirochaetia bacterium]
MKKILMGLLVVVTLMVLGTCNPFQGPDTDGTITLYIGNRSARAVPDPITVQPTLEYQFTATNGTKMETITLKRTTTGSMALSPGTWDITAKAYLPGGTVLVGTGRPNPLAVKVVAGQNTTAAFTMVFENTEIDTLTIMDANNTLTPTFDPDTATYTVVIPPGVTNITVEATPQVAGAELSYHTDTSTTGVDLAIDTPEGRLTTAIPGAIEIDVKGSSGYTTTYTVIFAQIINALGAITDITAPVHDGGSATAIISAGAGYTGSFAWTSGLSGETSGTYVYGTPAEATVTLTAETGYTFTETTISATDLQSIFINGSPTAANISNTGTSLSFTLTYTVAEGTPSVTVSSSGGGTRTQHGDVLTATITNPGGPGAISYQWKRTNTPVPGATGASYTLTFPDMNEDISVEVSRAGYSGTREVSAGFATAATYTVGDTGPAGGIIFYIDTGTYGGGEWKYLEAAPADIPGLFVWATTNTNIATDVATGKGQANTAAILAVESSAPAAAACVDYGNGTAYDDWFLPSKNELDAMRSSGIAGIVGETVANEITNPLNNFSLGNYWSSSEYNNDHAWFQRFSDDNQGNNFKANTYGVRAVRAF